VSYLALDALVAPSYAFSGFSLNGLGAVTPASEGTKKNLTTLVRSAETTIDDVMAGKRSLPPSFSANLAYVREQLMNSPWSDSTWTPEAMGGWPTSRELVTRVNAVHAKAMLVEGKVSSNVVDPKTGRARVESPAAAAGKSLAKDAQAAADFLPNSYEQAQASADALKLGLKVAAGLALLYGASVIVRNFRGSAPRDMRDFSQPGVG
jgi:hypothetical protein